MLGPSLKVRGGVSSVERLLLDELAGQALVVHVPTLVDGSAPMKAFAALAGVARFIVLRLTVRPELVHIHFASRASFWRKTIFVLLARVSGVRVLGHAHGAEFDQFFGRESGDARRGFIRSIFRRMDAVIAISRSWAGFYRDEVGVRRTLLLPNPVPMPATPIAPARADDGRVPVLVLGRLGRRKGTYDLLRAIPLVLERAPQAAFVIAGDGDIDEVRALVAAQPWRDRVEIPGWIAGAERAACLARAQVFALPSHNEGLPMGVLEAMAAGLPIVSTTVGGIPEMVEPGGNGYLTAPGDHVALADALTALVGDAQRRQRFGARSRELVAQRFELGLITRRLRRIYAAVARRPGAPESIVIGQGTQP
ncbi:MAG TPA: glycosyltransferase family 4 protein [Planctomycetota bacterium]|nr:glycosyltransferase family 4 protein [Planctomycetota bacterium]